MYYDSLGRIRSNYQVPIRDAKIKIQQIMVRLFNDNKNRQNNNKNNMIHSKSNINDNNYNNNNNNNNNNKINPLFTSSPLSSSYNRINFH